MTRPALRRKLCTSVLVALSLAIWACAESEASHPDAQRDAEAVSSPPRPQTAMRVQVARVQRGPVDRAASATGVVFADRTADVAAEVAGRVLARLVEPGAQVAAGTALVRLDATQLDLAKREAAAALQARRVDLAEAVQELSRADELARQDALSQSRHDAARFAVDRAQSAQSLAEAALGRATRALADTTVRAPFAGTVEDVRVDVGDYAQPGTPVATVADFKRVRVKAGMTAAEAADITAGQEATAEFADLGGERLPGAVTSVGRVADRSGTYTVEVWLTAPDPRLREGMVAELHVTAASDATSLLVPRSSLLRRPDGLSVFVVDESHDIPRAIARRVRVGRSGKASAEIVEGLEEGERVVTAGLFALRDGAAIQIDDSGTEIKANLGAQ